MAKPHSALLLSWAMAGCVSTSGHEWLSSPIDEPLTPAHGATSEPEPRVVAAPRLSRTITLGESYAAGPPTVAPEPAGHAGVQVNVHTQVPVVINNYAGFGFGHGALVGSHRASAAAVKAARAESRSSPQPGSDFPPPPSYGPPALK